MNNDLNVNFTAYTSNFTVIGMTCMHCVSSIKEEVFNILNTSSVSLDLATGSLLVTSDKRIDKLVVKEAVQAAGYDIAEEQP